MKPQEQDCATIDLLRHGSCEGGEIYRGSTDVALNAEGWQQMERAISLGYEWHCMVTSPLRRCRDFSEVHAKRLGLPLKIEPALREMNFGSWEGKLLQDVWQQDPALVSDFYRDPGSVTPPLGEPAIEAQSRVRDCWKAIARQHLGEKVLLVCHGGVIRLLLGYLLDMPLSSIARLHLPYASMTRIKVYRYDNEDFPVLVSLNAGRIE